MLMTPGSVALAGVVVAALDQLERELVSRRLRDEEGGALSPGALARAAASYALHAGIRTSWPRGSYQGTPPETRDNANPIWPIDLASWSPTDPRSDMLLAAGLLLVAVRELDCGTESTGTSALSKAVSKLTGPPPFSEMVSRAAVLKCIGDELDRIEYGSDSQNYVIALAAQAGAEALIKLLEVTDCGSVGGFDTTRGQVHPGSDRGSLRRRYEWLSGKTKKEKK